MSGRSPDGRGPSRWARRYDERGQLPPVAGVARRIAQVAAVLRCTLDALRDMVVRDESPARAGHDARELARQADLAALVRRPDMQGLQGGVDVAATAALHRQGMPSAYEQGLLRSVLAGAVRTQVRQFKADFVPAPTCLACNDGPEDEEHMYWRCAATGATGWCGQPPEQLPTALRCCGIMPADFGPCPRIRREVAGQVQRHMVQVLLTRRAALRALALQPADREDAEGAVGLEPSGEVVFSGRPPVAGPPPSAAAAPARHRAGS